MAKELFKPLYAPPGYKFKDAKAAGLLRQSETWWVRVWDAAARKPIRESTKTNDFKQAKEYLKRVKERIAKGEPHIKDAQRITFGEIAERIKKDYEENGQHTATLTYRLANLTPTFGARRMSSIRQTDVDDYVTLRREAGAANGTVNRELSVLRHAFRFGRDRELITATLKVRKLEEGPARQGFFDSEPYEAVLRHLTHIVVSDVEVVNLRGRKTVRRKVRVPAEDLKLACQIMHTFGWRLNEVMGLEKRHVDLVNGTLSLDPGTTKNDDARIVYLTPDLRLGIEAQLRRLSAFERASGRVCRYLFTHTSGRHAGQRIKDFVRAWKYACKAAGVAGRLRHDFRRTAVRNMVNVGVPERVAMTITGHKTRSVFDRYHIVSPTDLQRAAKLLAAAQNGATAQHATASPVQVSS